MAHIGTIAVEVTFIMGALNLVSSRMRGVSPGLPATAGFILGVLLVSWSNTAAGWSHGITGILLGLATPMSLIVAESILSRAIIQRKKSTKEVVTTTTAANVNSAVEQVDRVTGMSEKITMDHMDERTSATTSTVEPATTTTTNNVKPVVRQVNRVTGMSEEKTIDQVDEPSSATTSMVEPATTTTINNVKPVVEEANRVTRKSEEKTINHMDERTSATTSTVESAITTTTNNADPLVELVNQVIERSEEKTMVHKEQVPVTTSAIEKTVVEVVSEEAETLSQPTTEKERSEQKLTIYSANNESKPVKKVKEVKKPAEVDDSELIKLAKELYKEVGKLPSQRGFANYANISRYRAGRILQQLKEAQ